MKVVLTIALSALMLAGCAVRYEQSAATNCPRTTGSARLGGQACGARGFGLITPGGDQGDFGAGQGNHAMGPGPLNF